MKFGPINILLVLGFVLISSCVTTKKSKSETGWLKTKMHDMNARYNGYFNAKEIYKASLAQLTLSHEDNYNHILNIYTYVNKEMETGKYVQDHCLSSKRSGQRFFFLSSCGSKTLITFFLALFCVV